MTVLHRHLSQDCSTVTQHTRTNSSLLDTSSTKSCAPPFQMSHHTHRIALHCYFGSHPRHTENSNTGTQHTMLSDSCKVRAKSTCSKLISWGWHPYPWQRGWDEVIFKVPSNPSNFMIQAKICLCSYPVIDLPVLFLETTFNDC